MHLIRKADAPTDENSDEFRRYWLPDRDPFEVIEGILQPSASQSVHSHETVREAVMVLEGEVFVAEIIAGKELGCILHAGDFVVFDCGTPHFVANRSAQVARSLSFKFLGKSKDRALFLTDKKNLEQDLAKRQRRKSV